jgi:hypothetical protein
VQIARSAGYLLGGPGVLVGEGYVAFVTANVRRREFIAGLGGVAAWPWSARGQSC